MPEIRLEQVLHDADSAAPPPPLRPDLAERVLRRGRWRSTGRRIATAAILTALIGPLVWRSRPPAVSPVAKASTPSNIAENVQAAIAEQTVLAMSRDRAESMPTPDLTIDSAVRAYEQSDETAGFLVMAGDEMARKPASAELAADDYRQVIRHFPQTRWAAEASDRLRRLRL
jgi:hypothetical protein